MIDSNLHQYSLIITASEILFTFDFKLKNSSPDPLCRFDFTDAKMALVLNSNMQRISFEISFIYFLVHIFVKHNIILTVVVVVVCYWSTEHLQKEYINFQ